MDDNMYGFLLNMWLMDRIDEDYLDVMVRKEFLTEQERQMIVATPKIL
ncbi:hypothetical protein [Bacillus licheniformis]|nr:hypothetical protein [Bacillus licheniformis]MED0689966.1 hypothetical protein [Bacillus licheniformis]MED0713576.1 hypothetical protein [Bacillus licheniformis]MED0789307.1 hypothetical protein [Bacillus licheniformis]TWM10443.1 hypothetical protein CHCC15091_0940 [Bacillus licheniformis]WIW99390.1 hypothetical protein QQ984_03660 [Bacillus licheniformis]